MVRTVHPIVGCAVRTNRAITSPLFQLRQILDPRHVRKHSNVLLGKPMSKKCSTYGSVIGLIFLLCACDGSILRQPDSAPSKDDSKPADLANGDIDIPSDRPVMPKQPMCVWNQAYQENFAEDKVSDIVSNAKNCYVLVDPFGSDEVRNRITDIKRGGNIVGCYISSGTCENWRDDFNEMKRYCVSKQWGQWAGEYFVDETDPGLIELIKRRIDKMAGWGCDMVEFDNMDWAFDSDMRQTYWFSAIKADANRYNQSLCDYTHLKNMGCMAKNTRRGAETFDGVTFESYNDDKNWWTTNHLQEFLDEGKPGIIVHYNEDNCDGVLQDYRKKYGSGLSYICEDRNTKKYKHY